MGVVMMDERDNVKRIMESAVQELDKSCPKAFKLWNSVWNDNGGGG